METTRMAIHGRMDKKYDTHTHTHTHTPLYKQKGVLISHKNEGNSVIRDKMDGP